MNRTANDASRPSIAVSLPRQVPLAAEADVLVVGGGPGGLGGAVAAARQGADVLLVEHYGFLGGMATAGEVNPFMPNHLDNASLDTGIFEEWLDRIGSYGGRRSGTRVFDPNLARLAAEDLCLDAGVRLLYHHRAAHVERSGDRLDAVVLHGKSGLAAARAKVYVDSTGDGDIAALAGCEFEIGGASGHCQPLTLCFKLKLDPRDVPEADRDDPFRAVRAHMQEIQQVFEQAKADGRIDCPRENVLLFRGVDDDVIHFNTTRVIHKLSIDAEQLSEAEVLGRRQLRQIVACFQREVPLLRHCRIHSIAPQIGVRESRRVLGRAYLTVQDYEVGRTFDDGIARVTYPIDIHNPDGKGTVIRRLPAGAWYEVPYRCLVPRGVENLLIASRCISADHATHSSLRVMPPVCSIGQAAGTAAAWAVRDGVSPAAIDGAALKRALIEQGRNLVDAPAATTAEAAGATETRPGKSTLSA